MCRDTARVWTRGLIKVRLRKQNDFFSFVGRYLYVRERQRQEQRETERDYILPAHFDYSNKKLMWVYNFLEKWLGKLMCGWIMQCTKMILCSGRPPGSST